MTIKFKKHTDPHLESVERRMKANEEYLETMVAGTEEYERIQKAIADDYELIKKMTEPKIKFGEVVAVIGAVTGIASVIATIVTSENNNKTKKEIANLAYQKEEIENQLKNGTVMNMVK